MDKILEISNINKKYNDMEILINVSFDVKHHEKVALVGLNGVGKTTLVNIINNVIESDSGYVKINTKVATCFSENFLPQYISIYELIKYRKLSLTKLDYFLKIFNIEKYKHTFIENLSSGTKKKMELIFTLLKEVEFIILDEPTVALDFLSVVELSKYIKEDQRTYLIISHDFAFLNQFVNKVLLLKDKVISKEIEYNQKNKVDIVKIFKYLKEESENII